jgi:hypothetical protein
VTKATPHELRDSLVQDAVESVKDQGEVNVHAVNDYIVDVLRNMDRKKADAKKPVATKADPRKPTSLDQIMSEYKKRGGESEWSTFSPDERPPAPTFVSKLDPKLYERLGARLRWLRSKPEYKKQIETLSLGLMAGGERKERAANKLRDILEVSDRLVGRPWWKPAPKRIWSRPGA